MGRVAIPERQSMRLLRKLRRRRVLKRWPLSDALWDATLCAHSRLPTLDQESRQRLRELATVFAHEKTFLPVRRAKLDEALQTRIAALACLPVLNLGLDWYRDWHTLILYPAAFVSPRRVHDEHGLVQEWEEVLSGEASSWGPVVLSVADVEASGQGAGYNVVVHEMAHKLGLLNGAVNGFPPLHSGMSSRTWSAVFQAAYDDLNARLAAGEETLIDPYAAENPGEFFAVLSEYFFDNPILLTQVYQKVYEQLRDFYRQDPAELQNRICPPRGW